MRLLKNEWLNPLVNQGQVVMAVWCADHTKIASQVTYPPRDRTARSIVIKECARNLLLQGKEWDAWGALDGSELYEEGGGALVGGDDFRCMGWVERFDLFNPPLWGIPKWSPRT